MSDTLLSIVQRQKLSERAVSLQQAATRNYVSGKWKEFYRDLPETDHLRIIYLAVKSKAFLYIYNRKELKRSSLDAI